MKISLKTQRQTSALPSEPAVALASTATDNPLSPELVAKCSLLFIEALSKAWIASDHFVLAIYAAKHEAVKLGIEGHEKVFAHIADAMKLNRNKSVQDFMG